MSCTKNTTTEKKRYGILLETKMPLTPFRALEAYTWFPGQCMGNTIAIVSTKAQEEVCASSTKRGESL